MTKQALILIDIQNDYFPGGNFPLWQPEQALANSLSAIAKAREKNIPVILVQHVADGARGPAPFFNRGTPGVDIHEAILRAAPEADIVTKADADAFHGTRLEEVLRGYGSETLLIGGMMSHNCVTHTALSKAAEKYQVKVLGDCSATVSQILQHIALAALAPRLSVQDQATAF